MCAALAALALLAASSSLARGAAARPPPRWSKIELAVNSSTGFLKVTTRSTTGATSLELNVRSTIATIVGRYGFGCVPTHPEYHCAAWNITATRVSDSVWLIEGAAGGSTTTAPLLKVVRTVTVERWRVLFTDAIYVGSSGIPGGVLGLDVTHTVELLGDSAIVNATVPGSLASYSCRSLNEQETSVDPTGPRLHRGTFGNPSVHVQSGVGGVGLLPLDDVTEVHAFLTQSAIAKTPGWPAGAEGCQVTSPPSLSMEDKYLALAAGGSHVMEFALYPTVAADGSDYFSFINSVRADIGADQVSIPGAGYLGMYPGEWNEPFMADAGYPPTWEQLSTDELKAFYSDQAMYHVHNSIPISASKEECRPSEPLYCHGSCFVNELLPDQLAKMKLLINRTHAADPDKSILLYSHSMISAETNASTKYADSWITNSVGEQVKYLHCANGSDYPLFFATESNLYGAQMKAYYDKVMEIGFSGVCESLTTCCTYNRLCSIYLFVSE